MQALADGTIEATHISSSIRMRGGVRPISDCASECVSKCSESETLSRKTKNEYREARPVA